MFWSFWLATCGVGRTSSAPFAAGVEPAKESWFSGASAIDAFADAGISATTVQIAVMSRQVERRIDLECVSPPRATTMSISRSDDYEIESEVRGRNLNEPSRFGHGARRVRQFGEVGDGRHVGFDAIAASAESLNTCDQSAHVFHGIQKRRHVGLINQLGLTNCPQAHRRFARYLARYFSQGASQLGSVRSETCTMSPV